MNIGDKVYFNDRKGNIIAISNRKQNIERDWFLNQYMIIEFENGTIKEIHKNYLDLVNKGE